MWVSVRRPGFVTAQWASGEAGSRPPGQAAPLRARAGRGTAHGGSLGTHGCLALPAAAELQVLLLVANQNQRAAAAVNAPSAQTPVHPAAL